MLEAMLQRCNGTRCCPVLAGCEPSASQYLLSDVALCDRLVSSCSRGLAFRAHRASNTVYNTPTILSLHTHPLKSLHSPHLYSRMRMLAYLLLMSTFGSGLFQNTKDGIDKISLCCKHANM